MMELGIASTFEEAAILLVVIMYNGTEPQQIQARESIYEMGRMLDELRGPSTLEPYSQFEKPMAEWPVAWGECK